MGGQDNNKDGLQYYVDAMIADYRKCEDEWWNSDLSNEAADEAYYTCADDADTAFIVNCGDNLPCVDEIGKMEQVAYAVLDEIQTDEFWKAVEA